MSKFFITILDTRNTDTWRNKINTMIREFGVGYGSALPSVDDYPDGKLWYIGSQGYQLREGAWVAL